MLKKVAVILLNWNTPELTINCISSLLLNCNDEIFDIIIVDNGSTDDSLKRIKSHYPTLHYIDNGINLGFAEGNNKALEYSIANHYSYSLLINTDAYVKNDIISPMLQYIERVQNIGILQPAIYWASEPTKLWNGGGKFNKIIGATSSSTSSSKKNEIKNIDWATGCCILIRNSALSKVGLFNRKYFLYYEDVELSFRFKKNNYQIHYFPLVKVYHIAGVSGQTKTPRKKDGSLSPIIHYYNARNKLWILRAHSLPLFFPTILIYNFSYYSLYLTYFLIKRRWVKAQHLLKGIHDGLTKSWEEK